jgi:hypothetical protein
MQTTTIKPGVGIVLVVLIAGCQKSPAAPSQAPSQQTFTTLQVHVFDTIVIGDLFRKIPGATVTLLDGPQGGMSATTDDSGTARFQGSFGDAVTVGVVKDGYNQVQATAHFQPSHTDGSGGSVDFFLTRPDLVQLATGGRYSVTIATNGSCPNLPANVQTRNYTGTVTPSAISDADGHSVAEGYRIAFDPPPTEVLTLYVSGRDVSLGWDDDDSNPADRDGVRIWMEGQSTVTETPASVISFPVTFQVQNSDGQTCNGTNGRFTLTRQ